MSRPAAVCSVHTCYHFDDHYVPDDLVASLVGGVDLSEKGTVSPLQLSSRAVKEMLHFC